MNKNWKLKLIESSVDFWAIYDELCNDECYLINEREQILEAYKNKELYGLEIKDAIYLFDKYDNIFAKQYNQKHSEYLLPCFCIKTSNIALMLWVHSRARRMGIGTKLLELLKINYVLKPNNDSKDFWKKCDIQPLKFL